MIGIVHATDHQLVPKDPPQTVLNEVNILPIHEPNNIRENGVDEPQTADSTTVMASGSGDGEGNGDENLPPTGGANLTAGQSLRSMQHLYRPATILMIGDSYIRRLQDYENRCYGPYANLGFDFPVANVSWLGIGGMTVRRFRVCYMEQVHNVKPDIVFIHLGGNDLCCYYKTPEEVGEETELLVEDLLAMGVLQVVVSQQVFRHRGFARSLSREDYNRKITVLNYFNKITYNPNANPNVRYWYHHGLWNKKYTTLCHDGVHLNSRGSKNFLRSIRGAMLQAVARARPQLALPGFHLARPVVLTW